MTKYINKVNGKNVIIVDDKTAGMCNKTFGTTMVVYKYDGDSYDHLLVMEHIEFYKNHFKSE